MWVCAYWLKALLWCHSKEKLQMSLHWDPSCNLSASKMKRLEESEKRRKKRDPNEIHTNHSSTALESHVLLRNCYHRRHFKLIKTSALQLIFLTESNSRKLMLHLFLGVCSVFWKNIWTQNEYSFSGLQLTRLFSPVSPHQSADKSSQLSEIQLPAVLGAMQ